MKYLIGIDIGTTGTKSVLFDEKGNEIASSYREYPMYQPQNGYAEQEPSDWWEATRATLKELCAALGDERGSIAGIGLSGQMHSLVMLDENCEVIRPAILWCDTRTAKECAEIESIIGRKRLIEITANPALAGFTASKIMWVKNNEPENFAKCKHILLAKDYVRWKLTGEFATDVSDASGMQLLDVKKRKWSEEVCEKLGIDLSLLARVYESAEITGTVTDEASSLTGVPSGTIVAGGGGDNAASAVGTGVCTDGRAFTTIGTSGVVFSHTSRPIIDKKGRVHTFCAAVPNTWHVMGVTQAAGLSLKWYKSNFAGDMSYKELDEKIAELPIGSEKLIYLPYLMGERTPILDPDARGTFIGLSAIHNRYHLARAVMEGVSYSLYSCIEVLSEMGINVSDMAICGGGAGSPLWRKMIADVYGFPVKTMSATEGAALGAAILAGTAAGVYETVEKGCEIAVKTKGECECDVSAHEKYTKVYNIYKSIYLNNADIFKRIGELP